jgi:hypothetical protein
MRYALFSNASGAVLNIIMLDDPAHYTPPVGTSIRPDDGTPIAESITPPPVPDAVDNAKARAVLLQMGLFTQVDDAVKAAGGVAEQAWEYASQISRQGQLISMFAQQLGFSEEQLDSMFIAASQVVF